VHPTTVVKVPLRLLRSVFRGVRRVVSGNPEPAPRPTTASAKEPGRAAPPPAPAPPPPAPEPAPEPPRPPRDVSVFVEPTPNPHARKFVCSVRVVERGSRAYDDPTAAASDPLASALFALGDVAAVFAVRDFVTVTRQPSAGWADLEPRVVAVLEEQLR
jgi:hypothetical protein